MGKKYHVYTGEDRKEYLYEDNQYEEHNRGCFYFKERVKARYIEQEEPTYIGNMLIEALPPIYTMEQIINKFQKYPLYSSDERMRSGEYRIHAITRLKDFMHVFIKHIEIQKKIDLVIKRGYTTRHVFTPEFARRMNFTSSLLHDDDVLTKLGEIECLYNNTDTPIGGGALIGISGGGKTLAINNVLSLVPQCIVHTQYKESKFIFKQIPWIKIDCTHNGNLKGLCRDFFEEVDKVLVSNYLKDYGSDRKGLQAMIAGMVKVVEKHALGMLVIDEIQHLADARNGADEVLNFLVTLENKMKVPIYYIGTYKAVKRVLGKDFRQARRASGIGEIEWTPMDKDDVEWDLFISKMWKYQWTKNESPLTQELKEAFYECTMGITERVVKLYMASQIEAILSEEEKITSTLVRRVSKKHMPLTRPMIEALRTKNTDELAKYDDICSFDIQKFAEEAQQDIKAKEQYTSIMNSNMQKTNLKRKEIIDYITVAAVQFGISAEEIVDISEDIIKQFGLKQNLDFYMKKFGSFLRKQSTNDAEPSRSKSRNKTKGRTSEEIYKDLKEEGKVI